MQETENIWHAEPKVAEICNSGAYYILSMLFLPIIFVALLAELEKRGEEATRERESKSDMWCVRVGLLVLETEDGD